MCYLCLVLSSKMRTSRCEKVGENCEKTGRKNREISLEKRYGFLRGTNSLAKIVAKLGHLFRSSVPNWDRILQKNPYLLKFRTFSVPQFLPILRGFWGKGTKYF